MYFLDGNGDWPYLKASNSSDRDLTSPIGALRSGSKLFEHETRML